MSDKFIKPKIVSEVINFLTQKGHTCQIYIHSTKTLNWCCQDVCENLIKEQNMKKRNNESLEFAEKLKNQGHKCVSYL